MLIVKKERNIYHFFSHLIFSLFLIFFRACPLATLGVGVRLQVRGRATWGRKAAKRASAGRFFAAASPALPALAGFPPPASRRREMASVPSLSYQLPDF